MDRPAATEARMETAEMSRAVMRCSFSTCPDGWRNTSLIESYQKALELSPNSPVALYNLAATFAVLRRKDKMIEALSRAIANDGEYKDEALNDPAFREYWNDRAFKDVAEG